MKLTPVIASFALFSAAPSALAIPVCYMDMYGVRTDLSYMCNERDVAAQAREEQAIAVLNQQRLSNLYTYGVRAVGNNIEGTLRNSGTSPISNITLTIRAQQEGRSEEFREVTIDQVGGRTEADFVATFNHSPQSWSIESIEIQ
ncbi:hypothetical protein D0962_18700 [Leptolyngbyaceae cyanobacterium CCMR0082]|uniref:Uncharacterized protein n=2 Tax=Adonisia turfae TaxID=2950184 RepID=A0A6M0S9W7_9CYAN|nr:hypothetical protein [Adonisia turfae]MDV3350281.1 hypothetical protein [Leptothoe sp. LEGE 181152]NEZ60771.1 hypothetical protein [Adonisia turfae CCMR0081]NEZ64791.1 hypothetical protein [Adonisia turfae CCMR0082]